MATPPITKVAITGVSGRVGSHYANSLLETGKHTVTAITHAGSKGTLPAGVQVAKVDYDDESSLVAALTGQQVLIITLSVFVPPETHDKLVKAAVKAGVSYIVPNTHGGDINNDRLAADSPYMRAAQNYCKQVEELGSSYIAVSCGFWYEWSLALPEQWFGFTIKDRKVTFFDDGNTKISTSTWIQCGRAMAALLSLPESGATPCLQDWKNKTLYFSSFEVSQRDMLDSLHRVLGTTDKDWEITYEPTEKRFKEGNEELAKGIFTGRAKSMYSRSFYPNGDGNFESKTVNKLFALPKEDLDEATKRTVEMVESGWKPF
ncbi:NAD(P)-binding protein [Lojkania enalia]|uniref:NAD(P)-binding protein n=1 Tax=Lojkania enalia TaxID=147567 RepID=A0A9P4JYW8_9PLEO|nr:NAD(P)-binding protein [Didymosphaeria enalia]